jgi:hypothetical protein
MTEQIRLTQLNVDHTYFCGIKFWEGNARRTGVYQMFTKIYDTTARSRIYPDVVTMCATSKRLQTRTAIMADGRPRANFTALISQICTSDPRYPLWACDQQVLQNTYIHIENQANLRSILARMSKPKDNPDFAQYFRFTGRSRTIQRLAPCFVLLLIVMMCLSLSLITTRLR